MKKTIIATALTLCFATSVFAKDIIDTAVSNGNFKTLATALSAAGLVDTLKGPGPFTVFAPTDEAFAKIPKADLDALLKDKAKLSAVLTYHVVAGKVMAADVIGLINKNNGKATIPTVNGENLTASLMDGSVVITDSKGNSAKVIVADLDCSNGVVHVIDRVLLP